MPGWAARAASTSGSRSCRGIFASCAPICVATGRPGFPGPDQLSITRLAQDVVELAEHVGCKQFHLAGSSAGAIVSIQATLDFPRYVRTLANFASTPGLRRLAHRHEQVGEPHPREGHEAFSRGNDRRALSQRGRQGLSRVVHRGVGEDRRGGVLPLRTIDEGSRPDRPAARDQVPDAERHPGTRSARLNSASTRSTGSTCRIASIIGYEGLPHNITDSVPERCAEDLLRFLLKYGRS